MAEDKSTTPEQQLLKLIEGQGQPGAGPSGSPAPRKLKKPGFSLGKLAAALSFRKRQAGKKKAHSARLAFGIGEVNKALIVATVFLFVYVVFDAGASARNLQRPPNFVPSKEVRAKTVNETAAPLAETAYYLQKVSARDIFKEGKKEPVAVAQTQEAPVAEASSEAVESLALVGISWSANPDAIIEDKSKQRTYFVKRGQDVGDGVKVEAIFKDHVVVTYEDREYELR